MTLLKAGFLLALLVLANAHAISQQQQKTMGGGGTSQGVRNQRDSELPIAELPIARGRDKREVADTIPNDPTMRWTRCNRVNQSIYDFTLDTLNGHPVTLNKFKGNQLLIVNVATFCAYTEHYLDFGPLLDKFQDLRVLAFPCNQFGLQEPGENHEILNGIRYVRPGNDFQLPQNVQMFAKVEVNGQKQNPLFEFLKQSCPPTVLDISKREQIYWNPIRINDITWNFEKFLIDREGIPRFRFHPTAWDKGQLLEQFMAELGGGQQVQGMGSQVVMGPQQQQGEGEMQ